MIYRNLTVPKKYVVRKIAQFPPQRQPLVPPSGPMMSR